MQTTAASGVSRISSHQQVQMGVNATTVAAVSARSETRSMPVVSPFHAGVSPVHISPGAKTHQQSQVMIATASTAAMIGPNVAGSPTGIKSSVQQVFPGQLQPPPPPVQAQQQEENANQLVTNAKGSYKKIIDVVYKSIANELEVPEEPLCKLDCGCRAIDMIGLTCKRDDVPLDTINNLTPILRRGRSKGWMIHSQMAFPLTNICGRTMWVASELIMVFLVLGLSIARYSCGDIRVFNTLHLALSILASVLGIFDIFVLFCGCPFVRCGGACRHTEQLDFNTENGPTVTESTQKKAKCQECCLNATRNAFDVGRMIVSELIFYPLLICAIFDVITSEAYYFDTDANQISFVLFIASTILMVAFVYFVRLAVSIAAIPNLRKKRVPPEVKAINTKFDTKNSRSATCLQVYFVLHAIGQMVVQIVMLVSSGIIIHAENTHILDDCTNEEPVRISGRLWYMLVAGLILPIFGLLNFYFLTYYWLQEFPIGVCVDFLNATKVLTFEKGREKLNKIRNHFSLLEGEFDKLRNTCCFYKFAYPFQSPVMVPFSFVQIIFHATFITCAIISLFYGDHRDFPGLSAFWFFIAASVVIFIMNLHAFIIIVFWALVLATIFVVLSIVSAVVLAIVAAIGGILIAIFIIIVCISAACDD